MSERTTRTISRRAEETRARLLKAGCAAFSRKPLSAVKLKRDILEPAHVSVGSFYHQFKDKGALLVAILEDHSAKMRRQFSELHRPSLARSPEKIAHDSYEMVFDMLDQNSDLFRILLNLSEESDPRVSQFNERDRVRWHESRKADYERIATAYDIDLDVDFAAELIGMLTNGAIRHYLAIPADDRPATRERLIRGLVRLTLHGLPGLITPNRRKRR